MLEINGFHKHVEEDSFVEGCLIDSDFSTFIDGRLEAETQNELIQKVCDFLCVDCIEENFELNACDEKGRIDICILENGDGYEASKLEIEKWKKGNIKLYYCCYSVYVKDVKKEDFSLIE